MVVNKETTAFLRMAEKIIHNQEENIIQNICKYMQKTFVFFNGLKLFQHTNYTYIPFKYFQKKYFAPNQ